MMVALSKISLKTGAVILTLLLISCGNQKIDTSAVREEMKAREVRVIPEAKIIARALALGDSLIKTIDPEIALTKPATPLETWKLSDTEVVALAYLLSGEYDLAQKEEEVFQAYQYAAENQANSEPNIQKMPNNILMYNAPIRSEGKLVGMWSIHFPKKYAVLSIED